MACARWLSVLWLNELTWITGMSPTRCETTVSGGTIARSNTAERPPVATAPCDRDLRLSSVDQCTVSESLRVD